MISQFKRGINIQFLKTFFEEYELKLSRKEKKKRKFIWRMKDTTFYNQISLVYEDYHSTKSIKVFPNGSIQVAGCADLFDCKRVIKQLSCMFSRILGKEYVIPRLNCEIMVIVVSLIHDGSISGCSRFKRSLNSLRVRKYENVLFAIVEYILT